LRSCRKNPLHVDVSIVCLLMFVDFRKFELFENYTDEIVSGRFSVNDADNCFQLLWR